MSKTIKSVFILVILVWVLFATISLSTVRNPYEFIIPFVLLLLPFLLLLSWLSLSLKKNSTGWQRILALTGIYTGIISFVISILTLVWDLIR